MFGSDGVQLFQRIAGARECWARSDRRLPLRSEHFPVEARGREIVTQQGVIIAVATDSRDERRDRPALERKLLERPRGAMGALTSIDGRWKVLWVEQRDVND
jgi:hypothetical protein